MKNIRDIFESITERYDIPIRIGSRCEASTFYHIELLSMDDIEECAHYVAEGISRVSTLGAPDVLVVFPDSFTPFCNVLARELGSPEDPLETMPSTDLFTGNGTAQRLRGKNLVLVNDVITTARSSLEVHSRAAMLGASVMCWAALIDRTFGPGPVPIVTAFTGEPVKLL
jgi:hypothetical protein